MITVPVTIEDGILTIGTATSTNGKEVGLRVRIAVTDIDNESDEPIIKHSETLKVMPKS